MQKAQISNGFLIDTVTREVLRFQHNPERYTYTRTPNWASSEVPGMSHPKLQYINGGAKKLSLNWISILNT